MFDLEKSIRNWRQEMLSAGIGDPGALDELESHLRDEVQKQIRSGCSETSAFESAVRQLGGCAELKSEFAKAGEGFFQCLKRLICTLAGIPEYQLATNMNASTSNIEPGWVTYLKATAVSLPALVIWTGACVFVVPKVKEMCAVSGVELPPPAETVLQWTDFFKNHLLAGSVIILPVLVLLEWRSRRWSHYRRPIFGVLAFAVNLIVLVSISILLVCAAAIGGHLAHSR